MTRPRKQNVDYFPHYCKHGKVLFVLESKYGNDGYAFFYKLLEALGDADGHFIDCSKPAQLEYLTAISGAKTPQSVTDILNTLSTMSIIDQKLWSQGIIWMQSFVDSVADVYRKRSLSAPDKPLLMPETPVPAPETYRQPPGNPQRIVKDSKVKDSKVKDSEVKDSEVKDSEVKDSEVKDSEVNARELKQTPTDPTFQDEEKTDPPFSDLKTIIEAINKKLTPYNQRQVMMFVESNMKGKNHGAIIHCLESLLKKLTNKQTGEEIKPRAYLEAALNGNDERAGEDGKHNAEDYIRAADAKKGNPTRKGMAVFSRIMAEIGGASP